MTRNRSRRFREAREQFIRANTDPCVFCGRTPATSAEDVIPNWLSNLAPEIRKLHGPPLLLSKGIYGPIGANVYSEKEFVVLTPTCKECNGGWLSRLESHVATVLRPLLQGQERRLSRTDQGVIVRWALKTAALLDHTNHPTFRALPPELFRWLCANRAPKASPPPHTEARIGRVADPPFALGVTITSNLEVPGTRPSPGPVAFRIGFTIGAVLLDITGTSLDFPVIVPSSPFDDRLTRIWPATGDVDWPVEPEFQVHERESFVVGSMSGVFEFVNTDDGTQPVMREVRGDDPRPMMKAFRIGEFHRTLPPELIPPNWSR